MLVYYLILSKYTFRSNYAVIPIETMPIAIKNNYFFKSTLILALKDFPLSSIL